MALKLKKTVNGYDFDYWRIDRFDVEPKCKRVWCRLGLYKDADYAHGDNSKSVQTKDIIYSGDNYPITVSEISKVDQNIIGELYKQIKKPVVESIYDSKVKGQVGTNTNEFTEAEDC